MNIESVVNADQTVTITYRGESRTFPAFFSRDGRVFIRDVFSGKFRSGTKLWPLEVIIWESGNTTVCSGGYSNKGGATIIVGWWNEDSKADTQSGGAP